MEFINIEFKDSFYKKTDPKIYDNAIRTTIKKVTLEAEKRCKKEAPYKYGHLRRGHSSIIINFTGTVINRQKYWRYVVFGTKPHIIKPKSSDGVLRWKDDDGLHYAKEVNHPGTAANNYPQRVLKSLVHDQVAARIFNSLISR